MIKILFSLQTLMSEIKMGKLIKYSYCVDTAAIKIMKNIFPEAKNLLRLL